MIQDLPVTVSNLTQFASIQDEGLEQPVKAVLLHFHGLGYVDMAFPMSDFERELARCGILTVYPYYGAWSWMNDVAVRLVDRLVQLIYEKYQVDQRAPLLSSGGSMGGLSALVYTRYAQHCPAACLANCPVCDLPYHYTERDDLPRTLYNAFGHYNGTLDQAMRSASPLHLAEQMPDIPYLILHTDADQMVNKQMHSDRFVEKLRKGHQVTYVEMTGTSHCAMTPEAFAQYREFIMQHADVLPEGMM